MNRLGITALITISLCAALTVDAFAGVSAAEPSRAAVPQLAASERSAVAALVEPSASGDTFRSCSIPHTPMKLPRRLKGSRGCGCRTGDPAGFASIGLVVALGWSMRRRRARRIALPAS